VNRENSIIGVLQAMKSLPFAPAEQETKRLILLVISLLLAVFLTKLPLDASDSSSRSVTGPNFSTERTAVQVLGVRSSSQANHSRVVIDLSADVRYRVGHLSNPERVFLDFPKTEIIPRLTTRRIAVQNGLINQVRIGTRQGPVTRVVLDLAMPVRYGVSKVDNPARMVIELSRPPEGAVLVESIPLSTEAPGPTLARTDSNSRDALPAGRAAPSPLREDVPLGSPSGPQTYGNGEKAGLNYAGTTPPRNILALGLNVGSSYDDNIFGNNQQRVSDVAFQFGPSLNVRREGQRLNLALSYQPHFRIYRKASEENVVDQSLGFDAAYRASPRLSFRARTSAFYTTGIFQPNQNEEFLPGLGSPSGLNDTLFTPTARQLTWSARIDTSYQISSHDSLGVFVGQSKLDFRQQYSNPGSLQNTDQKDAGVVYEHRLSPHTTLGIDYQYQDILFGPNSRARIHSPFFSYAQQISPSLTLSVFGGPQFSHLNEVIALSLGPFTFRIPVSLATSNWTLGGTLTKQLDKTAFQLTGQHQVSDGGGLLGAVVSSSVGTSVRRRLTGRWDASWNASYANNNSLDTTSSRGAYQSLTAGAVLERSLTEKLSVRLGYNFIHQRGSGQSSLFGNFDRDLWSVQFSYRFHEIALGR
jgi:AMIN domain-containing protein